MGMVKMLTEQLAQEKARNEQPAAVPPQLAPQTPLPSIPFNALPVATRASETETVQGAYDVDLPIHGSDVSVFSPR